MPSVPAETSATAKLGRPRIGEADLRLLRELSEATTRHAGEAFLQSVVLRVCEALNADFTFVGELREEPSEAIHTVAVASAGTLVDDFDYPLAGSPCENVVGRVACSYPRDVAAQFPDDPLLADMGIEAYLGFPLFGSGHRPLGLIAALFRHPLEASASEPAEAFLKICSSRIASELEYLQAESALKDNEEKLRLITDNLSEMVTLTDAAGRIQYANPSHQRILGFDPKTLVGRCTLEFMHPDDRPRVMAQHAAVFEGRASGRTEYRCLKADGSYVWLEGSVRFLRNDAGNGTGMLYCARDLSEQKGAEATRRQYEHIVRSATDMLALVDENFVYVTANAAYNEAFADATGTVAGRRVVDVMGETVFNEIVSPQAARCFAGETAHYQRWFNFPNTGQRYMDVTCTPYRGGGTQIIGFVVTGHDITDIKQAEERLRESEEKYRSLFESSRDAIMTLGPPSWDLTSGNPAMLQMFKAPDEADFVSRPPWEYSPKYQPDGRSSADKAMEMIERAMREGSHYFEWTHKRRTGDEFPATVLLTRIEIAGKPMLQATVRDITEIKRAEEERSKLEERYRHSQKMEAIGRLGGGIAHDFNNLLTVINGCAEFALAELRDGDALKVDLQHILDAGQRAAALTAQLLAFSRKQTLEPRVIDLNDVVAALEPMLQRLLGEDIELRTKRAPGLGRVKADPGQIDQVLMNLAVNASDAMPRGGKLTIETANVDVDADASSRDPNATRGPHVRLTVTDTGIGMTAEQTQRVFEPFYTTKPTGHGTGLGLATVYGIVMQSGGTMSVDSEPGRGTTFSVCLPRVEAAATESPPAPKLTALRGTETVLVIEDESSVRDLTCRILSEAGYQVIIAGDGGEALLECERYDGEIHLVLTDVVMPRMNGKELADHLAALRPDAQVLYMSGYTGDALADHGILEQRTHFITKPFNAPNLLKKVRAVLDGGE